MADAACFVIIGEMAPVLTHKPLRTHVPSGKAIQYPNRRVSNAPRPGTQIFAVLWRKRRNSFLDAGTCTLTFSAWQKSAQFTTLRYKRAEIEKAIAEKRIAQATSDLAHINAAIAIFEASGDSKGFPAYVDVHRLFKRGEPMALCKQALAEGRRPPASLPLYVMKAKGLDQGDRVLAKSIGLRLIHALRMQSKRGGVIARDKHKAARILELPPIKTLV
jgi:hypothetical protein